jgi:hypothetical protein
VTDEPKETKKFREANAWARHRASLGPIVKALANVSLDVAGVSGVRFSTEKAERTEVGVRETQLGLLQELSQAGIDPHLFDLMLSNELDRSLKKQFGVAFLVATIFFTLLSYGIIVFNSIEKWGITGTAITALIVETPIQFIGLLYIIARNLFPQSGRANREQLATTIAAVRAKRNAPSAPQSHLQPDQE